MRRYLALFIFMVTFPMIILAQNLNIHKNDGSLYTVTISDIDSITFTNGAVSFGVPCPGIPTVTYGGQTYNTVQIGDQCWFKENLNIGTKINSTAGGSQQTDNNIIEKYCYNNDEANCATYGGLYEWNEAMQYVTTEGTKGICPDGWHIPTLAEFQELETYVGDQAAKLVREDQPATAFTPTNETGFSALFAGIRNYNGYFYYLGNYTYFWSSTEYNSITAYYMYLYYYYSDVRLTNSSMEFGFSVRCLKD